MAALPQPPAISKDVKDLMEVFDRAYRLRPTRSDLLSVSPLSLGVDEDNVDEILAEIRSYHHLNNVKLRAESLSESVCGSYIERFLEKCPLKDYGYEKEAIRTIGLQLLHENRSYDLTLFLADLQTYGWDKALHGYKKRKNEIWDAYTYIGPLTYLWIAIISISEVVYFLLMLKVCASGFQVLVISSLAVLYVNHSRLSLVLSDNDKLLQQMHFYLEEYRLGQKTRREAFEKSHRQDKRKRFQANADILKGIVLQLIAVLAIVGTVSHLHLW